MCTKTFVILITIFFLGEEGILTHSQPLASQVVRLASRLMSETSALSNGLGRFTGNNSPLRTSR